MSRREAKYENLSEKEIETAKRLAEEDEELGPVFEAMLDDVVGEGWRDQS